MTEPRLTCRQCVEFLLEYIDDTMSAEVRVTFERHLAACANCVRYLESYRATTRICKKAFDVREGEELPPVPEELIKAILATRPKAE